MSGQKVWAKHYQADWEIKAGDKKLPQWFRVAALAYGKHRANGHAQFGRGDIALILGHVDEATGEMIPDTNASRAIRTAIGFGLLSEQSNLRCLVVPRHAIEGPHGNPNAHCTSHEGDR